MKNKRILSALFSSALTGLILMTCTVLARGTLLTYEDWGIRGKYSNGSFTLNSGTFVRLKHTNSHFSYNAPGNDYMDVTFHIKGFLGFYRDSGYKLRTKGNGTSYFSSNLPRGTYKLYFNTIRQGAVADIKGVVTN